MARFRNDVKAEHLEYSSTEFGAHHCLTRNMRSEEKSFKERAVRSSIGSHFCAKSGSCPDVGAKLDKIFSSADISTRRCKSAAGVFNQ